MFSHKRPLEAAQLDDREKVRLLLRKHGVANDRSAYNDELALVLAASSGNLETIRLLLDRGVAIDQSDKMCAALREATDLGLLEAVRLLLGSDAIDPDSGMHWSALMWAANQGKLETVRLLLERGAPTDRSGYEITALSLAERQGHKEVVNLIKEQIKERERHSQRKETVQCTFALFSQKRKPGEEERPEVDIPKDVASIIDGYMNPVISSPSIKKS